MHWRHSWSRSFEDAVFTAHFRADITQQRYRVYYDRANKLWNLATVFPKQPLGRH